MSRKQKYITETTTPTREEVQEVKVTMKTTYAGPDGTATPGTVIEASETTAKHYIEQGYARAYDPKKDARSQTGPKKAPEKFE